MKRIILNIDGMSCSACAFGLEKYLKKQEGIKEVSVNLIMAQAFIIYDDSLSISDLEQFIKDAGFESLGPNVGSETEKVNAEKRKLIFFAVYVVFFMLFSMLYMKQDIVFSLFKNYLLYALLLFILTIPFLFYGLDIFKSGFKKLYHKMPNMDTLVTLGVSASLLYSFYSIISLFFGKSGSIRYLYFDSVVMVVFFVKLGRYIDYKSKEKTKEAIKGLVQMTPNSALLKNKNKEKEVTIDEVKKGDILIAKPGMKIAVDGTIVKGNTHLNESFITGEAVPIKKKKNDKVVAGSINIDGYIEYKAERIGKNSTVSEIVHMVMEAIHTKMPIAKFIDVVSSYFTSFIIILAIITFLFHLLFSFPISDAFEALLTVLLIACPCALGLATPLAIVISEGICAQNGILVKSSETLEFAKNIDTVVFDKTGTLTYGDISISKIYNYSKYTDEKLIEKVASVEAKVSHPIANAFLSYAKGHSIRLKDVKKLEIFPGIGVAGMLGTKRVCVGSEKLLSMLKIKNVYKEDEKTLKKAGNSIIYVVENDVVLCLIGVKDIVRRYAKKTIMELKCMRKDIIMLTGDNEQSANKVAQDLGITHVIADVVPKEKKKVIMELIKQGKKVMMIGDGINDAPSLVHATIGVSITDGTDIAVDASDVVLLNNRLDKICSFIRISRNTILNIKQNLFWAFFYNVCMLPIAMGLLKPFGIFMNPIFASFAMMLSSITVAFNALRLKKMQIHH